MNDTMWSPSSRWLRPLALLLLVSFGCGNDDPSTDVTTSDTSGATDAQATDGGVDATTTPSDATTTPSDATTSPTDATTPSDTTTSPTDATTSPTDATTTPSDATTTTSSDATADSADSDTSGPARCAFDDECSDGKVCYQGECRWCTEAGDDPCFGICDPATKQCRACTSNADCDGIYLGKVCDTGGSGGCIDCHVIDWPCKDAPGGPHCNFQNHRCEPCRDSFDCSSAGLAGSCQDGECVGCTDDAQCEIGICHLPAGTCGHCTSDAECVGNPNGPSCKTSGGPGHGKCFGCKTNDDCGFTNKCDVATGLCGNGCTTDADCANGSFPTCITTAGIAPFCGCQLGSVCPNPALPSCDSYTYQCEKACTDDSECTYPEVCWSGFDVCMIGFPE